MPQFGLFIFFFSFYFLNVVSLTVLNLQRIHHPTNEESKFDFMEARDQSRHTRLFNASGITNLVLNGSQETMWLYFTTVKIGYPPKEFNVIVDTGSDVLEINCQTCHGCLNYSQLLKVQLNFYDPRDSASSSVISCSDGICHSNEAHCSFEKSKCIYSFNFYDGSTVSGYFVSDLMGFDSVLGNKSIASTVFGCSVKKSGIVYPNFDGIFGFGQHELSIISQLSSRGLVPNVFSHCLNGMDNNGGGILVLGEIVDPQIVYSPLVNSQHHYNLILERIAVNGQTVAIDTTVFRTSEGRGTFVDSGTTLAYLVEEAYEPFVSALFAAVPQSVNRTVYRGYQCFVVTRISYTNSIPPVTLTFAGGASMVLKPEHYGVPCYNEDIGELWCLGFRSGPTTILGGSQSVYNKASSNAAVYKLILIISVLAIVQL